MPETLLIPRRFNGPLDSGQGGCCSGVMARFIDGPAEVDLRRPVPLDLPLDVARDGDGSVRALDGEALVLEARPAPDLALEVPAPVTPAAARRAAARCPGPPDGLFSRCFVCGPARDDAFGVFAGAVEDRRLVASPWTPPGWTADASGRVRPEFLWAVLDCPTYFAAHIDAEPSMSVLARFSARIDAPARAGEELVIVAWPLEAEGRKRLAAAAVLSAGGATIAVARALMIELRD